MMERRELFKVLGAALVVPCDGVAQHDHRISSAEIENYKPRFFSGEQYRAIDALTEVIIPTDEQSPGAHAAGVRLYIDTVLLYADPETQQRWRRGLASVDQWATARFGRAMVECTAVETDQVVAAMARNEKNPSSEMDRFFTTLKQMTVEAYALSDVGMTQHFGYKGNTAIREFPGCTHPEHQTA
jgi:hypothetical protein